MATPDESKPSDPLLPQTPPSISPISFTLSPRPFRDLPFSLLFSLLSLSSIALGIFSICRHSSHSSCNNNNNTTTNNIIIMTNKLSSSLHFKKQLIFTVIITALLVGPIAFSLLSLFRRFAKQLVYICIPFFILIPSFLNVYWFVSCLLSPSCSHSFPLLYRVLVLVFVFAIIGLFLWIIIANWHRVELTVQIIKVSAVALLENVCLMVVGPGLIIGLLIYVAVMVVFLVFATGNGTYSVNGDKCVWREDGWVKWYFGLAIVTMIWAVGVMVEVQAYVISGTVGMWYFVTEGTRPRKCVTTSLRNAFGPSFGTVCFSGMVVGVIRVVRAIVDSAQHDENATGFVNLVLSCCARFLFSSFDFVNKFTINFAAITGEAYCPSAKMTYELLMRNLLSAVFVETVSTRILVGITFVFSALYAIAVFAVLKAIGTAGVEIYFIAALAWLLLVVVLGYFVQVLENVIDTIYVCYAIDRDRGEVSKQEVHEVYVMLPISRNHRPSLVDRTPAIV